MAGEKPCLALRPTPVPPGSHGLAVLAEALGATYDSALFHIGEHDQVLRDFLSCRGGVAMTPPFLPTAIVPSRWSHS
jgi:hypothetical protein